MEPVAPATPPPNAREIALARIGFIGLPPAPVSNRIIAGLSEVAALASKLDASVFAPTPANVTGLGCMISAAASSPWLFVALPITAPSKVDPRVKTRMYLV